MDPQQFKNALNHVLGTLAAQQAATIRQNGYLARLEIERLLGEISGNPKRLEHFGFKVYSQTDEDGILEEIFKRLNIVRGFFCEIGVENGLECNSLYLLHKGWRGAWIDANSRQEEPIRTKFQILFEKQRLFLHMEYVVPQNINPIILDVTNKLGIVPADLDFLSIDVDGMDIYLMNALNFRPKVICIEYNAKFPPHISKIPIFDPQFSWRNTDYMGSSLKALHDAGLEMGYRLVSTHFCGNNAFFVRTDLINEQFDLNAGINDLYHPPRYHLYFDYYKNGIGHKADFGKYVDF